jgi:hypothetical protein
MDVSANGRVLGLAADSQCDTDKVVLAFCCIWKNKYSKPKNYFYQI